MTDDAQAKEVVEQIKVHVRRDAIANVNWLLVRQAIATALQHSRRAGLEEAAVYLEGKAIQYDHIDDGEADMIREFTVQIRQRAQE